MVCRNGGQGSPLHVCVLFLFLSENNSICGCKIYLLTVHSCKSHGSCNCYQADCTAYNFLFFHIHGSLMRHQSRSNIRTSGVYLFPCSWLDFPIVPFTSVDIIRGNVQVLWILWTNKCLVVEGICPPSEIYLSPFLIGRNRPINSLEWRHDLRRDIVTILSYKFLSFLVKTKVVYVGYRVQSSTDKSC